MDSYVICHFKMDKHTHNIFQLITSLWMHPLRSKTKQNHYSHVQLRRSKKTPEYLSATTEQMLQHERICRCNDKMDSDVTYINAITKWILTRYGIGLIYIISIIINMELTRH